MRTCFLEKSQLSNFKKKQMPLKLFEYLEQFIIGTFLVKVTKFEKGGSISKVLSSLVNLIIKFQFRNHVFRDLYTFAVRYYSLSSF